MNYKTILFEKSGGIATITLNRPKSLNALNSQLLRELDHVLSEIEDDDAIGAAIITGNERSFAAGADIAEIEKITSPMDSHRFLKLVQHVHNKVEDVEKPMIAAVSGLALGGGCELALACDLRLAADTAIFGLPEIKIGVLPGGGGTQRLSKLVGTGKAKEMIYLGDPIDAQEAYRIGLVNKVFPAVTLMDEARKMALKLVQRPGAALKLAKLSINGGMNMGMKAALKYEVRCQEILFSTDDQREGMKAFIEKRKPVFKNK